MNYVVTLSIILLTLAKTQTVKIPDSVLKIQKRKLRLATDLQKSGVNTAETWCLRMSQALHEAPLDRHVYIFLNLKSKQLLVIEFSCYKFIQTEINCRKCECVGLYAYLMMFRSFKQHDCLSDSEFPGCVCVCVCKRTDVSDTRQYTVFFNQTVPSQILKGIKASNI